jgi:hypothetical protein
MDVRCNWEWLATEDFLKDKEKTYEFLNLLPALTLCCPPALIELLRNFLFLEESMSSWRLPEIGPVLICSGSVLVPLDRPLEASSEANEHLILHFLQGAHARTLRLASCTPHGTFLSWHC